MALDEPKDDDQVFNDNGITYLVNKDLLEAIKPIHVDFVDAGFGSGFSITSSLSQGGACGTCSSC
jgi:Fe-S cluster assembly iron-binding protein IscA